MLITTNGIDPLSPMKIHVASSYLDMARAVVKLPLSGSGEQSKFDDAVFGIVGCNCIFSYMAMTAFCSRKLHDLWEMEDSKLRTKYKNIASFEQLMKGPLIKLKCALNELSDQFQISRIHDAKPELWRKLNELLKKRRDYFVHPDPDPEKFHKHVESIINQRWGFSSQVATEIIRYFFEGTNEDVPGWLTHPRLRCIGFEVP